MTHVCSSVDFSAGIWLTDLRVQGGTLFIINCICSFHSNIILDFNKIYDSYISDYNKIH